MITQLKHTAQGMILGAVLTIVAMASFLAPHLDWRLHWGNQPEEIAQVESQAVALADLMPVPAKKPKP